MSATYNMKRSGDSTEPWGRPNNEQSIGAPMKSFTFSFTFRLNRNECSNLSILPWTPNLFSLVMSVGRCTESNAFWKSMNRMIQASFFFFIQFKFAIILKRYLVVDLPAVKPSWSSSKFPSSSMKFLSLMSITLSRILPKYDAMLMGLYESGFKYVLLPSFLMKLTREVFQIQLPVFMHQLNNEVNVAMAVLPNFFRIHGWILSSSQDLSWSTFAFITSLTSASVISLLIRSWSVIDSFSISNLVIILLYSLSIIFSWSGSVCSWLRCLPVPSWACLITYTNVWNCDLCLKSMSWGLVI